MSDEDAFAGERSARSDRPVRMEWTVETCGPVALVSVRLDNRTASAQPIRLSNRLDGPTLPPRRRGVPEAGWDEEGFSGTVPPSGGLALGYACPLAAAADGGDPLDEEREPVELSVGSPDEVEPDSTDAATAVRELGAARPPRDAVPVTTPRSEPSDEPSNDPSNDSSNEPKSKPEPPTAWLDRVEGRIGRAERLDGDRGSPRPGRARRRRGGATTGRPRRTRARGTGRAGERARRPRRRGGRAGRRAGAAGVIVAVAGGKGGVGKSTTAYNLGAALNAVVVDADLGMADLPTGPGPDLHDVLAGRADPREAVRGGPVDLLPCGRSLAGARAADVRALGEAVRAVERERGRVVVDCPAGLRADAGVPLAVSDVCVLVVSPRAFALADAIRTRELARELDAGLVAVVLNRVADAPATEPIERCLGAPVEVVPADPRVGRTVERGRPVTTTAPDSRAADAYRAVADAVRACERV